MERRPAPGEFYRHFKNKYYQIVGIAKYSETKEEMVVYQALYDDFGMYVRPLSMFVSEVDHIKYPRVTQKYRFERICADEIGKMADTGYVDTAQADKAVESVEADFKPEQAQTLGNALSEENSEGEINPILLQFLEEETHEEKLKYLNAVQKKLTDELIDAMAASIDVTVPEGEIYNRYLSLKSCLAAHAKYEVTRRG